MKATELKILFPGFSYSGNLNVEFNRIELDSRKIQKFDLFVAMKGIHFDSHKRILEAIRNGATVVVSEKDITVPKDILLIKVSNSRDAYARISAAFFGFPSRKLKVVGITGTSGKTTTAYILYSFFNRVGIRAGFLGTLGEDTGSGLIFKEKFPPTTPDAFYLNRALSDMVKAGIKYVFIEVSSSAILFNRISGINFYRKILTNIGQDHLEVHKTFQNYLNCKLKFFEGDIPAILNRDSLFIEDFLSVSRTFKTYGIKNKADFMAHIDKTDHSGMYVTLSYGKDYVRLFLKARGEFNLYNFLAFLAFTRGEGIPLSKIEQFAANFPEIPGRMNSIETIKGTVIIDFAHNPYEIEAVLNYARQIKQNRLITVVGAVGWSTVEKRYNIGKVASSLSDVFILTTDDPRGADPDEIIRDVKNGSSGNIVVINNRFNAIRKAVSMMKKGDVVAILGRGEEREIHFRNKTVMKSDEECVREILDENKN